MECSKKINEYQNKKCIFCEKYYFRKNDISFDQWNRSKYCSKKCSIKNTGIPKGQLPHRVYSGMKNRIIKRFEAVKNGDKNPNWRGGISWQFLRMAVLKRDDFSCKICGHREPFIMEVDHIKPKSKFPELKKEISNLVTLCPNCHRRKTNKEAIEYGKNARRNWLKSIEVFV